jgi:hypothetical protein
MLNRKNQKRDVLNSIRLTLLDWDPMDLFAMGHAGLEEYDEYISDIAKYVKKSKNVGELESYLVQLATEEMDVSIKDQSSVQVAAEKLYRLNLE